MCVCVCVCSRTSVFVTMDILMCVWSVWTYTHHEPLCRYDLYSEET